MTFTKTFVCTFAATIAFALTAPADTIDFESLMQVNTGINVVGSSYTENGFLVDGVDLGNVGTQDSRFSGSTALTSAANSVVALSRVGGGSFSLTSIDLSELDMASGAPVVTFVGFLTSGGTTSQSFELDGLMNAAETFTFDSTFNNIVGAVWIQGGSVTSRHQFDNLQVSAIPEPASAAIICLGLTFGLVRRRR